MNTHILISIKEWEERIKCLRKISDVASEEMQSFYNSAISELLLLKELCNGKQISLDEKDITTNVAIAVAKKGYSIKDEFNIAAAGGYVSGYKQALEYLLL